MTAYSGASTAEPEPEEISPHSYKRHKKKGNQEEDFKGIETKEISHELSDEQLTTLFGKNGWKRLPDEVYKRLTYHPATFLV